jgi:hypothetical protein
MYKILAILVFLIYNIWKKSYIESNKDICSIEIIKVNDNITKLKKEFNENLAINLKLCENIEDTTYCNRIIKYEPIDYILLSRHSFLLNCQLCYGDFVSKDIKDKYCGKYQRKSFYSLFIKHLNKIYFFEITGVFVFWNSVIFILTYVIKKMKKVNFDKFSKKYIYNNPTDSCSICINEYKNSEIRLLDCNHFYHIHCIDEWLINNKNCPICRKTFI